MSELFRSCSLKLANEEMLALSWRSAIAPVDALGLE